MSCRNGASSRSRLLPEKWRDEKLWLGMLCSECDGELNEGDGELKECIECDGALKECPPP